MKKLILSLVLGASAAANANPALLLYAGQAVFGTQAAEKAKAENLKETERRELAELARQEKRSQENQARLMREVEDRLEKQQLADNLAEGTKRAIEMALSREEKERLFPGRGNGGKDMLGFAVLTINFSGKLSLIHI